MIRSFSCKETEKLFFRQPSKRLPLALQKLARRKLLMIHVALSLSDLKIPPGNRLEKLSGDRKGQCSIRVNQQWRICFVWKDNHAEQVALIDYH